MERGDTGLADQTSTPSLPVEGFTDRETVKLDFDKTSLWLVVYWSMRACVWFRLEGGIILESSKGSYHVVFNRAVSWDRNLHIVCWVAMMSQIKSLIRYALMQGIKESSTLRVGPKGEKPSPRVVYHWGEQRGQIKEYLKGRREINKIARNLPPLYKIVCGEENR
jgi:hypothetical protein